MSRDRVIRLTVYFVLLVACCVGGGGVRADIILLLSDDQLQKADSYLASQRPESDYRQATNSAIVLATTENKSFPQAHYDLAVLLSKSPKLDETAWEIVFHLEQAAAGGYQAEACHTNLGQIYISAGKMEEAVDHLQHVAQTQPGMRLKMARALLAMGKKKLARTHAEQALAELDLLRKSAKPGSRHELDWIASLEFLERFDEAIEFLRGRHADNAAYAAKLLGRVYSTSASVARREKDVIAEAQRLCRALEYDPDQEQAVQQVFALQQRMDGLPEATVDRVQDIWAAAAWTAQVHLVVGSSWFQNGFSSAAVRHLEQAYRQEPNNAAVLNNLAWFLSHGHRPDLQRSLQIANELIVKFPLRAEFRETRGQIYALMEQWEQAQADLKAALPVLETHRPLHVTLAKVYEELGMRAQAGIHQATAEKLARTRKSGQ